MHTQTLICSSQPQLTHTHTHTHTATAPSAGIYIYIYVCISVYVCLNVTQQPLPRHIAAFGSTRFSPACLSRAEWSTTILLKPPTCKSLCKPRTPTPVQCNRNLPARTARTLQRLITGRTSNAERRPVKASARHTALKRLLQPLK